MNEIFKHKFTFKYRLRRAVWNVTNAIFVRPFGLGIFWPWRRLVLRLFGAKIHKKAYVYSSVKLWAPWHLKMEEGACLAPNVICYNHTFVEMKKNATVSQYSHLCTAGHDPSAVNSPDSVLLGPITIGEKAWVGAQAFISMGVIIGEGAIVGATASVYKDVEPWTVVGGNPAKVIKKREIVE